MCLLSHSSYTVYVLLMETYTRSITSTQCVFTNISMCILL